MSYDPHPTVQWELTRLCDQHCRGCPMGASERRDPNELSTYEAYKTIDQIAALRPRELIITGGDPLERDDVYAIIDYARHRGLDPALVLAPTHDLTFDAIDKLAANGLTRAVFGVDGSIAATHESIHGVEGTFAATLRAMLAAESVGLQIEVNTMVVRNNVNDLEDIVALIRPFRIARWNVHFVVPVAGSCILEMITAAEVERVFQTLEAIREREKFAVRTVEALHYRRYRVHRLLASRLAGNGTEWADFTGYQGEGTADILEAALDGVRSFVYVSHAGDVRPSEFAPQSAGNLRYRDLGAIYRRSDLFTALRDPDALHGKCRRCEFRMLCGGSRARAYAMTGDLLGTDPLCAYEPQQPIITASVSPREAHS
jgi:radical SAM protein with 4Fe4S-binding SPASM domain